MPNEEQIPSRAMFKTRELGFEGAPLEIPVEIIDYKSQFGRTEYLVTPVGGKGEKWVQESRLVMTPEPSQQT